MTEWSKPTDAEIIPLEKLQEMQDALAAEEGDGDRINPMVRLFAVLILNRIRMRGNICSTSVVSTVYIYFQLMLCLRAPTICFSTQGEPKLSQSTSTDIYRCHHSEQPPVAENCYFEKAKEEGFRDEDGRLQRPFRSAQDRGALQDESAARRYASVEQECVAKANVGTCVWVLAQENSD